MATATAPVPEPVVVPEEQHFVLRGVDWETYRKLSEMLTGYHVRLTYDRGTLEFKTISGEHAFLSRLVLQLVVALAAELKLPRRCLGDMTCNRQDLDRALNPDECFYFDKESLVRGKKDFDLTVDPPPDLAVEIELSRSARSRIGIYAALGVAEVWRFDGQTMVILQLQGNRQYAAVERSPRFPFLAGADFAGFLNQRDQVDEESLIESFRLWVREQIRATGKQP